MTSAIFGNLPRYNGLLSTSYILVPTVTQGFGLDYEPDYPLTDDLALSLLDSYWGEPSAWGYDPTLNINARKDLYNELIFSEFTKIEDSVAIAQDDQSGGQNSAEQGYALSQTTPRGVIQEYYVPRLDPMSGKPIVIEGRVESPNNI
jgi:hypothetical protein